LYYFLKVRTERFLFLSTGEDGAEEVWLYPPALAAAMAGDEPPPDEEEGDPEAAAAASKLEADVFIFERISR